MSLVSLVPVGREWWRTAEPINPAEPIKPGEPS
jgi:hypothetical protein